MAAPRSLGRRLCPVEMRHLAWFTFAGLWATVLLASAQPPDLRPDVSPFIVRVATDVVADFGVGVIEARATSLVSEPRPALRASHEARRAAVDRLLAAIPLVPLSAGSTLADIAPERMEAVLAAARRCKIVAERRLDDGRVEAIASLPLYEGASAVLPLALGVETPTELPPEEEPRPALIVQVSGPVALGLLPQIRGPAGAPLFTDPERAVARGRRPVRYSVGSEGALRLLRSGQQAVLVRGRGNADVELDGSAVRELARSYLEPSFSYMDTVVLVLE